MMDNPLNEEGKSSRRKIVDYFEINLNRCILCGICVEVCNFDAIVMSHEHEMSTYQRNGDRVDLAGPGWTLERNTQVNTAWIPPTVLAKAKKEAEDAAKAAAAAEESEAEAAPAGQDAS